MVKGENKFILDGFTWSYSRVNAYRSCPYMFYLQYIQGESASDNAFAQFGTLCHEILADYYNGELSLLELEDAYKERYWDVVTEKFPSYKMALSYFTDGLNYFRYFEDQYADKQIVSVESEFNTNLRGYNFRGFIDLLLKDEHGFYIIDHKSKADFKSQAEEEQYKAQLYLYGEAVAEKYGQRPVWMEFNMFRSGMRQGETYSAEGSEKAIDGLENTIKEIYADDEFLPKYDRFFCKFLCGMRHNCCFGDTDEI